MEMTQDQFDASVKAAVDNALAKTVDSTVRNAFFGGGAQKSGTVHTYVPALDTPSMTAGQRAYLAAQRDPDIMQAMKTLGRIAIGVIRGQGNMEQGLKITKALWPQDSMAHQTFEKALTVTDPTAGGFTVPMPVLEPIIPFLYNRTAVRMLGATVYNLPNGNANIPRVDATSSATYTGEATAQNSTQPTSGNVKLSVKKLIALVPLSNDLIMSNSVNYEATVAQDLVNIMNIKADYTSLYGTGIGEIPLGLANQPGIGTFGTSSTTLGPDDPYTIIGQIDQANVPMISPGWIINGRTKAYLSNLKTSTGAYIYRDEIRNGELAGYPYIMSNQVTYTSSGTYSDWFFGDWSEFMWGEQTLLALDQSREAAFQNASGTTVSAYAQDLTLMRAISRHDFNVKHPVSFVYATSKLG